MLIHSMEMLKKKNHDIIGQKVDSQFRRTKLYHFFGETRNRVLVSNLTSYAGNHDLNEDEIGATQDKFGEHRKEAILKGRKVVA